MSLTSCCPGSRKGGGEEQGRREGSGCPLGLEPHHLGRIPVGSPFPVNAAPPLQALKEKGMRGLGCPDVAAAECQPHARPSAQLPSLATPPGGTAVITPGSQMGMWGLAQRDRGTHRARSQSADKGHLPTGSSVSRIKFWAQRRAGYVLSCCSPTV